MKALYTFLPLISLAALHTRGKFPWARMERDKLKLISEAVVCNSCSISEFAAGDYLLDPVFMGETATHDSECCRINLRLWTLLR